MLYYPAPAGLTRADFGFMRQRLLTVEVVNTSDFEYLGRKHLEIRVVSEAGTEVIYFPYLTIVPAKEVPLDD